MVRLDVRPPAGQHQAVDAGHELLELEPVAESGQDDGDALGVPLQ